MTTAWDKDYSSEPPSSRTGESAAWRRLIVGKSSLVNELCEIIALIAPTRCAVLITGETGTGKEIVAKAIHHASKRAASQMVAINCTALPASLIEAELFGHAKGAFTGAHATRIGRFEQANRGSLFLDEIGDLPIEAQAKLLRALQEQEVQRLGGVETIRLDVRILAATNIDLEQAVAQGKFREDLYYRLNVISIQVPALRDRREDIPLLVEHFLEKNRLAENRPPKTISSDALEYLKSLDWPGNIRQLEHAVQRAFVLSADREHLSARDFQSMGGRKPVASARSSNAPLVTVPKEGLDFDRVVSDLEKSLLQQALTLCSGNKARAADLLQIKRTTLLAKLKTLELAEKCPSIVGNGSTALVVEQDGSLRKAIASVLNASGVKVFEAADITTGVQLFESWRDQLCLIVLGLPLEGIDQHTLKHFSASAPTAVLTDRPDVSRIEAVTYLERNFCTTDLLSLANQLTRSERSERCA